MSTVQVEQRALRDYVPYKNNYGTIPIASLAVFWVPIAKFTNHISFVCSATSLDTGFARGFALIRILVPTVPFALYHGASFILLAYSKGRVYQKEGNSVSQVKTGRVGIVPITFDVR